MTEKTYIIIGSGMLAKAFKNIFISNTVVFASGVSNSKEFKIIEFDREKNLIDKTIFDFPKFKFVYFSSFLAVNSNISTPYSRHKREMEKIIQNTCENYLILRLPQVIGITNNRTLISYFIKQLIQNKSIIIQKKSTRRIIAVEDCVKSVKFLTEIFPEESSIINIGPKKPISALEIVIIIKKILQSNSELFIENTGEDQEADLSTCLSLFSGEIDFLKVNYQEEVIKKYTPLISKYLNYDK